MHMFRNESISGLCFWSWPWLLHRSLWHDRLFCCALWPCNICHSTVDTSQRFHVSSSIIVCVSFCPRKFNQQLFLKQHFISFIYTTKSVENDLYLTHVCSFCWLSSHKLRQIYVPQSSTGGWVFICRCERWRRAPLGLESLAESL